MAGSSWTGSAQNETDDLEARIASSIGDAGTGRQSLTDAIVQRVVDTVRAGVIVTTESMAVLSTELNERYDRLEGQLDSLADHVRNGPAGLPSSVPFGDAFASPGTPGQFDEVVDRLERLEALLDRPTPETQPNLDMTPVWETIEALRHELITRTGDSSQLHEVRDDLAEVRRELVELHHATAGSLAALAERAGAPVSTPDFSAADDVMIRIDSLETALRSGLAQIADAVMASQTGGPSEPAPAPAPIVPDLTPVVDAVGARLAELRGSLQGRFDDVDAVLRRRDEQPAVEAPTLDLGPVIDTITAELADLRTELGRVVEAQRPSHDELVTLIESTSSGVRETIEQLGSHQLSGDELRSVLSDVTGELEDVRQALVFGQEAAALQQETLSGRLASLQRLTTSTPEHLQDLRDALLAIRDDSADRAAELRAAIAATAEELTDRVTELRTAAADVEPVDLTPVREALEAAATDARTNFDRIGEEQRGLRALVDYVAQMNDSYNRQVLESVGGVADRLSGELGVVANSVGAVDRATDRLASQLAAVRDQVETDADYTLVIEPLIEIRRAVDHLGGQLDLVHQRLEEDTDFTAVTAPLADLQHAVDAATSRLSDELTGVRNVVDRGPDLGPVTERLTSLAEAVEAARTAIAAGPTDERLADIRTAVVAARGAFTLAHESLAGELTSARRELAAQVETVAAAVAEQAGAGRTSADQLVERLAGFERSAEQATSATEQVLARLAAIESEVAEAGHQLQSIPAGLAEVTTAAGRSAEDIAAIAHWTSVHDTPERLEQLADQLDGKLDTLAQVVPALQDGLAETRSAFDTVSESIVSSLDGLRAHLTASGGFTVQSERLRELRAAIETLADHWADASASTRAGGADADLRTLQATVDALLVRLEDRNREEGSRNATLETLVSGSARQLEDHVKNVLGGLGTNERLVRGRFDELTAAVGSLRGELSQIRSLRAEVAELGAGLDGLRNKMNREERFAPR